MLVGSIVKLSDVAKIQSGIVSDVDMYGIIIEHCIHLLNMLRQIVFIFIEWIMIS